MKTDLDALMQSRNLDAILITGSAQHNPAMYYLTGGVHLTNADLIKKRNNPPVLFCNAMERDEAAKTGFTTKNLADYNFNELLRQAQGDYLQAVALRYSQMLTGLDLTSGRLGIYGRMEVGAALALFAAIKQRMPELELVGEYGDSLLLEAMATKDASEVDRVRRMGKITTEVVGQVADYLTSQRLQSEVLVNTDGKPVTIGDIKSRINLWLAERGADNPEGTILAIGRDAAIPHSTGSAGDHIRLGQTIVFDIYPCEAGGGYFYDFTRTWCLGYASDDIQGLYQDVRDVYQQIMSELTVGAYCPDLQKRVCDLFEARGHPTIQSSPQTEEGYVHGLGHGLGLQIHGRPYFGKNATDTDRLSTGTVTTIEPGLYYPERGIGVRLEDTLWVRPDGKMEILAEYPLDLVLPMKR
jgi:Xaa-Pro aminopeptidase